jgi:hypothetical protein
MEGADFPECPRLAPVRIGVLPAGAALRQETDVLQVVWRPGSEVIVFDSPGGLAQDLQGGGGLPGPGQDPGSHLHQGANVRLRAGGTKRWARS